MDRDGCIACRCSRGPVAAGRRFDANTLARLGAGLHTGQERALGRCWHAMKTVYVNDHCVVARPWRLRAGCSQSHRAANVIMSQPRFKNNCYAGLFRAYPALCPEDTRSTRISKEAVLKSWSQCACIRVPRFVCTELQTGPGRCWARVVKLSPRRTTSERL